MIDIVKEESASPVVAFEHLKGGGEVSAVASSMAATNTIFFMVSIF